MPINDKSGVSGGVTWVTSTVGYVVYLLFSRFLPSLLLFFFHNHVAFGPLALLSHALIYSPTTFKILAHGTKLKLT